MRFFGILKTMTDKNYAVQFLDKIVTVKMDRPLGSKHPKYDWVYECNYGFVPNTKAPDGEETDVYILGVNEPLDTFTGLCIGVIHRTNDNDDKLIVAPEGMTFTDEEIRKMTNFQEQFFNSKIIRKQTTNSPDQHN